MRTATLLACLGAVGVVVTIAIAYRAVHAELRALEPESHAVPRPPEAPWLTEARDVRLRTPAGATLAGWLLPSKNGAAVLLVHGGLSDRTQLVPEAQLLAAAGYGVLLFDLPGNGESTGRRRRGDEADFLRAAMDALVSEPSVTGGRIGGYGFSSGAALLVHAAANDPRVRALFLAGCYLSTERHIRDDYRRWGPFSEWPAVWAARAAGVVFIDSIANVQAVGRRPVFLLAGDADTTVSFHSSERLYEVAQGPKELWIVPGARHGGYAGVAGDAYGRRLVHFFDDALSVSRRHE